MKPLASLPSGYVTDRSSAIRRYETSSQAPTRRSNSDVMCSDRLYQLAAHRGSRCDREKPPGIQGDRSVGADRGPRLIRRSALDCRSYQYCTRDLRRHPGNAKTFGDPMPAVIPERMSAKVDGDFVVFLIGMRVNKIWKVHKWLPVFLAMPKMLKELKNTG